MPAAEISAEQCRAARMMLIWEQADLGALAEVAVQTIKRFETRGERRGVRASTAASIRRALEAGGVAFVFGHEGSPGVRFRVPSQPEAPGMRRQDISAAQYRAARGLVGISQRQLADMSGLGVATIRSLEVGTWAPLAATVDAVRRAYSAVGVDFIAETEEAGAGVLIRTPGSGSEGGPRR